MRVEVGTSVTLSFVSDWGKPLTNSDRSPDHRRRRARTVYGIPHLLEPGSVLKSNTVSQDTKIRNCFIRTSRRVPLDPLDGRSERDAPDETLQSDELCASLSRREFQISVLRTPICIMYVSGEDRGVR